MDITSYASKASCPRDKLLVLLAAMSEVPIPELLQYRISDCIELASQKGMPSKLVVLIRKYQTSKKLQDDDIAFVSRKRYMGTEKSLTYGSAWRIVHEVVEKTVRMAGAFRWLRSKWAAFRAAHKAAREQEAALARSKQVARPPQKQPEPDDLVGSLLVFRDDGAIYVV